jgi:glycosyltransferase involved in cell wall biosynthesis
VVFEQQKGSVMKMPSRNNRVLENSLFILGINKKISTSVKNFTKLMIDKRCWAVKTAINYLLQQSKPQEDHRKLLVNFYTPLLPDATGVAFYNHKIIPFLGLRTKLTVFHKEAQNRELIPIGVSVSNNIHVRMDGINILVLGNSGYHTWINAIQRDKKTLVVLHDVFLGHERYSFCNGDLNTIREIYLEETRNSTRSNDVENDVGRLINEHPFVKTLVNGAGGVVVHSKHAANLVEKATGSEYVIGKSIHILSLPRQCQMTLEGRDSYLSLSKIKKLPKKIVSMGNVTEHKQSKKILAAFLQSEIYERREGILVFVGEFYEDEYFMAMNKLVEEYSARESVIFTGRVGDDEYFGILASADFAIQLRKNSRGESSGAIIDCLSALVPVIANRHGSFSELDERECYLLPDECTVQEIVTAINYLVQNEKLCRAMSIQAYRNNLLYQSEQYVENLVSIAAKLE